jgi:hypothetical protein
VSIVKTADRPWLQNQSVMKVAKVGEGAVFETTMFLATTGQKDIISAMMRCATEGTDHLPDRKYFLDLLRKYRASIVAFLTLFIGSSLKNDVLEPPLRFITKFIPTQYNFKTAELDTVEKAIISLIGALLFEFAIFLWQKVSKFIRGVLGY